MAMFLIGYDISNQKRLVRVHRALIDFATPIQYSIFLLEGSHKNMQSCMETLLPLINQKEDDLRCYQLPSRGFQHRLGKPVMPSGIVWTAYPTPL